ncbi:unnamed protein product [Lactuca saligna]|uniref:Xylulose kinase-1 n=1 Tax=Lactuca saligna TaxID=75948 RepID=A0AA35V8U5_LACSI|nr:unnamed protein product [Lactuca saligna]
MGDMEFAKVHNSTIFLEDPPAAHNDLKFIVDGLKKSCLVHALTTNPTIYQSLIKDFWRNAVVKKNDQGEKFVEATIKDKKIQVTESIIREYLQIEDRPEYPMEIDKLLPPCWKLLAHVFVSGISEQRSGANKISLANTGAIAALATEDVREESDEQSMPMENEYIFHSPSEPEVEEIHDSPTTYVADEHDNQKANDSKSSREDDDDDLYEDVEFLKEMDFTGINDDIPTNIEFDFGDEDFDPFLDIPSNRVNKVNEVAPLATKTRDEGNFLKILLSTSKPLEVATSQGDVTSEIPPSVSLVSTSALVISDLSEPQTSQTSMKTSQSLESLEVPSVRCAPQVISTITATSAHSPPKQTDEGPSTMFETGGSSSIPEYSPTRPSLDEASIRLVKHLAQSSPTSSRGKGISFNKGRTDDDKSSSPDLREEIGILPNYFNLKNVLYDDFGEKVKVLFQQPHGVVDHPSVQSRTANNDLHVNPPAPRTTTIVNRFEKELEGSRARSTIKQGKRIVTANQSKGLLFMKNSNENRKTRDPVLTVMDLKKRKFGDEYGDRTCI